MDYSGKPEDDFMSTLLEISKVTYSQFGILQNAENFTETP